ncbi:MAG TPA: hypothetical protein VM487_04065 [Phycisphaerae bacterium]|nr:hypothetical protein [Phycisphaerae bacterium]
MLSHKIEFVIVGLAPVQNTPPPIGAVFSVIVQLMILGRPDQSQQIPPPHP